MTDDKFDEMVSRNEWHTNLGELLRTVAFCIGSGFTWSWTRTPQFSCKYIDVRIDMRNGDFVVKSRDGERISLEQLKKWGL